MRTLVAALLQQLRAMVNRCVAMVHRHLQRIMNINEAHPWNIEMKNILSWMLRNYVRRGC